MKNLPLSNPSYIALLKSFTLWLDVLGFAPTTVYGLPLHIREFFHYLENKNLQSVSVITTQTVTDYYNYLKERPNRARSGCLSDSYLNKHQQALFKFKEYLFEHGYRSFME